MTRWIGHDTQLAELIAAAASARLHHGWILAGPRGVGKAGIATDFAARLLSVDPQALWTPEHFAPPGSQTTRLMESGTHPDFLRLERLEKEDKKSEETKLARSITADQARSVAKLLQSAPAMGGRRIILVDSADDLESHGANALLKALEEPPAGAIFLLISHMPGRLLPTIRSRCRMIRFGPLDELQMDTVLTRLMPALEADDRAALALASGGSPGRALEFAGLGLAEIHRMLSEVARGGSEGAQARARLVQTLSPASARERLAAFLDLAPDYLAQKARTASMSNLATILSAHEEVRRLADGAIIPYNLEPGALVRMICDAVMGVDAREPVRAAH